MVDKIIKLLRKLSPKERIALEHVLSQVQEGNIEGLDFKKISGQKDVYRVRKGDIRVIIQKNQNQFLVLAVERRGDHTYDF